MVVHWIKFVSFVEGFDKMDSLLIVGIEYHSTLYGSVFVLKCTSIGAVNGGEIDLRGN
jgi:hypothetical protein